MVHGDGHGHRHDEKRDNDLVREEEEEQESEERYLGSKQVCRRYGNKSDMTIWRWTRDRGFPQPAFKIGG